jgi:hypothetical protein
MTWKVSRSQSSKKRRSRFPNSMSIFNAVGWATMARAVTRDDMRARQVSRSILRLASLRRLSAEADFVLRRSVRI